VPAGTWIPYLNTYLLIISVNFKMCKCSRLWSTYPSSLIKMYSDEKWLCSQQQQQPTTKCCVWGCKTVCKLRQLGMNWVYWEFVQRNVLANTWTIYLREHLHILKLTETMRIQIWNSGPCRHITSFFIRKEFPWMWKSSKSCLEELQVPNQFYSYVCTRRNYRYTTSFILMFIPSNLVVSAFFLQNIFLLENE